MKRPTPSPDPSRDLVHDLLVRCLELHEERGPGAVEELLERHPESTTRVRARLDLLGGMGLVGEAPIEAPPERIGDYRVVGVLGRGGMGVVYEAEQERPRRRVALKVLRNLPDERSRARFEHEAELLARLSHPAVASIHEMGTATVGAITVPYIAMELVRGRPLDVYVGEESADLRTRVSLLARIAEAVHHAHQKGVVHRDLKPGNVLVDERGDPHVLDFGVARAIEPGLVLDTLRTAPGQVLGTIPYMSPEQAAGQVDEIDSRTDVYSLGVMAFELLSGRLPVDLSGIPMYLALSAVRDAEPPLLGTLDRTLRGDLETIVATALAKEKERRYASAHELAADLRRFLDDAPIAARPATASYQLRKFARRHRALVGAGLAVLLALLIGLGGTLHGLSRAAAERDDAERRFRQADTLLDFQEHMYQAADPLGEGVQVADLLGRSVLLVDGFSDQALDAAAIRLMLGKAYRGVGRYDEAEALIADAVSTFERELGADDLQSVSARTEWVRLLGRALGRPREAEGALEGLVERATRVHGPTHEATLDARIVSAGLHHQLGRYREGLELAREVQELAEPGTAPWIAARRWRSNFLKEVGEIDASLEIAREDLEWHLARFGRENPRTWAAMNTLGTALHSEGRPAEGAPILEELLELRSRFLGAEHPETLDTRIKTAMVRNQLGQPERSEELLLATLEVCERIFHVDHPTRLFALNGLVAAYSEQDRWAEAEPLARDVMQRTSEVHGAEHRNTIKAMAILAVILSRVGRIDEAEELYLAVLDLERRTLGDRHADTLTICMNLGSFYSYHRRYAEANVLLREAVETGREALGTEHDVVPVCLRALGECLVYQGEFDEAEELLLESRTSTERLYPQGHPERTEILRALEFLYTRWDKGDEAAVYGALLSERGD